MLTNNLKKKTMAGMLAFILIMSLLCAFMPVHASGEVVKVGYFESDGFQNGNNKTDKKSGYAYDYLQKIAYAAGWELEYQYGNWNEIYTKFLNGEVDVMAGMSKTDERAEQMLFPNQNMGSETYYIYEHDDDTTTNSNALRTMSGRSIGTIKNNVISTFLEKWIEDNGIELNVIYYDGFKERDADFQNGKLDYIAATGNNTSNALKMNPVVSIGESDYYIAVINTRPDLIKDINLAQNELTSSEPFYINELQYKYFNNNSSSITYTQEEKEWLIENSKIVFGYVDDYLPYCTKGENGNPKGIITDIVDCWVKEMDLEHSIGIEYVCYGTYNEMIEGLHNSEIDVAFPVVSSTWYSEQNRIFESTSFVSMPLTLLSANEYNDTTLNRIAISGHSPMQKIAVETFFPDSEIVEVGSAVQCLEAVLKGDADSTVFNAYRAYYFLEKREFSSLEEIQLNSNLSYCFGVVKGENILLSLLNKGLSHIDEDSLTNKMLDYTTYEVEYSTLDFIEQHIAVAVSVAGTIILLILLCFFIYIRSQRTQKKQMEESLREKEEQIIVEKQLTEDLTIAKQKAEDANNAKTVFLFNMSHDIRTPMNAIIGFTDLLEKNQDEPEKRNDYLSKIKGSSSVLLSIINNVLEMARIEKGTLVLDETAWSTEQFMDMLYSIFQEMMEKKNIEFTRSINVQHEYVYCDTLKLKEIFMNIISNSYKYTNPGGKVHIDLTELPSDKEGYVTYKTVVTDTGIGMSEEFLPHLFEEFSREHNTTENKIEGTGLGMPIVKRLVEFLGGRIEVESKKGEGTKFTVYMSHRIAEMENSAKHEDVQVNLEAFKGKHILLAEDNDLNAEIATELLQESGFEVERASDGQICVDMLARADDFHYDVILMDVQMPNLNGYGATKEIRKMESTAKSTIPIIAMTANAFEEDKKTAYEAGMDGHLAKPIDVKELMKTLSLLFN